MSKDNSFEKNGVGTIDRMILKQSIPFVAVSNRIKY